MRWRYFFILIIFILWGITYFTDFFIKKERSFSEILRLKQENENLKAQIQLSKIGNQKLIINNNFLAAKVFSTYPFNIKNEITVNLGEKEGIKRGMPVILQDNLLIGRVIKVFRNFSVVQTIFDPHWQLPVRISEKEIDGLFQGGNEPRVVLIEKEKPIQVGDFVYSASSEFPYGLKIGEILEIKESPGGAFKEAVLRMLFNVNELREVNILTREID